MSKTYGIVFTFKVADSGSWEVKGKQKRFLDFHVFSESGTHSFNILVWKFGFGISLIKVIDV